MEQELRHILDSSGAELLKLTDRHVAIDANSFSEEPSQDADIDPFYTLGDQLFVEPQPLVFPSRLELNAPIRMSRAEIAIARSHINVWRQVAASNHRYVTVLEDDVWFHSGFTRYLDQVWDEVVVECDKKGRSFEVLYLSYLEAKHGAPKVLLSNSVFRPVRGLWNLAGYVLSRHGAEKLLRLLPCRGPIDLWINHQFEKLDVRATRQPLVSQRRDVKSTNSYSILPTLTTIGAITSERAALFLQWLCACSDTGAAVISRHYRLPNSNGFLMEGTTGFLTHTSTSDHWTYTSGNSDVVIPGQNSF
jgi:GR25 family glycosyltransferase involved in LPS biosynthesis